MPTTILFLCPNGAANSVIAAAYFNQLARQGGLSIKADFAGMEPDEAVLPVVVAMLRREKIDVSQHQPRSVCAEELKTARRVVTMGCSPEMLGIPCERVEEWNDIPIFCQHPEAARIMIRVLVEHLITKIRMN
jgi:protein-tyrosine-phosphatase